MKPETLLEWSRNPASMPVSAMGDLRRCLQVYPCFYTARMLYLKILRQNEDLDYASELFQTSLSSPDRRQLFHFIRKDALLYENAPTEDYARNVVRPDSFVETGVSDDPMLPDDGNPVFDGEAYSPTAAGVPSLSTGTTSDSLPDVESDSFSLIDRYLDREASAPKTSVYQDTEALYSVETAFGEAQEQKDETELLRAIMNPDSNPQASTPHEEEISMESFAFDESGEMPESSFTLTLAKIYLKQKKYARALEILRALVLKNPEKSIYFADQIKYLERIINHLNK